MKKFIILIVFVCASTIIGLAQTKNSICRVIGNVSGTRTDTLIAFSFNEELVGVETMDTVLLRNGKFDYSIRSNRVRTICFANYPLPGKSFADEKYRMEVIVIPDIPLTIIGSYTNYRMKGSKTYEAIGALREKMKAMTQRLNDMSFDYADIYEKATNKDSTMKAFTQQYQALQNQISDYSFAYLKAHPDNNESAILIPYLGERIDEGLKILSTRIKSGILSSYYMPYKRALENRKLREDASKKMTIGAVAPDFTAKDIKGNDFSIVSLRGKYVLLDFWGSWCHWCIKGMPELKKYYEKYKGKFEIVGVDCNDTEEKWKAAVKKNQLPWIHVKSEAANSVSSKYGVEGYPTLIIIDPHGNIVKKFLGEDPEFFTTLDALFK